MKMKIMKMTAAQAARMSEWVKKYVKIGLSTEPANFNAATEAALKAYKLCNLEKPMIVLRMGSPYAATLGGILAWAHLRALQNLAGKKLPAVGAQVWDQVEAQVWDQVWAQVRAQVGAQVWDQVGAQVRDQVGDQVGDQEEPLWPWFYNAFEAGWLSFYDTMAAVGIDTSPLHGLTEMGRSAGPAWLWWDVALVCERPSAIHRNTSGLHCDGGMAVRYRDGWGIHALNGVAVPEWLAMTPAEELDPLQFSKIENAEVRREFVRKVGVERLCEKLGTKVLDKSDDGMYELHAVDLKGETGEWPYLKMKNPSIGVYHMEAVAKECRTVKAALAFRNGGEFEHLAPLT